MKAKVKFRLFRMMWGIRPKILRKLLKWSFLKIRLRGLRLRHPQVGDTTVIGLLTSSAGLGRAARLLADELRRFDYRVRCDDVTLCFRSESDVPDMGSVSLESRGRIKNSGVAIVVLPPPQFLAALAF